MSKKTVYTILIGLCIVGFWLFENFYTPAMYAPGEDDVSGTQSDSEWLPSSTSGKVVHHQFYSLSYSEPHEQAEWVAYSLQREHLTNDDRKRPYFIEDPKVKSKSADWRNYRGSGYDRGHLCPAGDRRFSLQAYNETFYTSNISPQDREFNAGIWNRLEQKVRYWCKKYGDLYVITGGVLEDNLMEIGEEDVDVPEAFYKVVVRKTREDVSVVCFLIPNEETQVPLEAFALSVDALEKKTNIDFFHNQSKDWQSKMESKVDISDWKF